MDQSLYEAQAQASECDVSKCNVTHTVGTAPCPEGAQGMKALVLHWRAVSTCRSYAQTCPVLWLPAGGSPDIASPKLSTVVSLLQPMAKLKAAMPAMDTNVSLDWFSALFFHIYPPRAPAACQC